MSPGPFAPFDLGVCRLPGLGQPHEPRPAAFGMRAAPHDTGGLELVDQPLHALARESHGARDLRHGERSPRQRERGEHLPAGGGEPGARAQSVSQRDEDSVEAERLDRDGREQGSLAGRRGERRPARAMGQNESVTPPCQAT